MCTWLCLLDTKATELLQPCKPTVRPGTGISKFSRTVTGSKSEQQTVPCFKVGNVRRVAKIEDEDPDNLFTSSTFSLSLGVPNDGSFASSCLDVTNPNASRPDLPSIVPLPSTQKQNRRAYSGSFLSVSQSVRLTSLPRTARVVRPTWSSREYLEAGGDPASTTLRALSRPYSGYSYSGFQICSPDPRYARKSYDNKVCSRGFGLRPRGQRSATDMALMARTGESALDSHKSLANSDQGMASDPVVVDEIKKKAGKMVQPCGNEDDMTVASRPASAGLDKAPNRKSITDDDHEDTINGTTLFDDSGVAGPMRKDRGESEEEIKPEDSLSNRVSPGPTLKALPPLETEYVSQFETSAQEHKPAQVLSSSPPKREEAQDQELDEDQRQVSPQRLRRPSLGDSFALDFLLPPLDPLPRSASVLGIE
ncbi:hypothetical protein EV356DRAFT_529790 [Viridothelium virens]|uniref:Uncharacterized protein n=1 Tax=Viridothelium virens TaxID=1048519 RepID=A0A6A6HIM1_VIRVR|nr:hypothetical protein EV356DRAFT_529790 [Viridothelium virens]